MPSILLVVKHALLDEHNAKKMRQVARDTETADTPIRSAKGATAPGDGKKLRGIPAIGGRGSLGGAIAGTKPGTGSLFNGDGELQDWE